MYRVIGCCLSTMVLLHVALSSRAQAKIHLTGHVVNSISGKPIEYAEVCLLRSDSTVANSTYTSPEGLFQFETNAGEWTFQVRYLGNPFFTQKLLLSRDTSLKTISVEPSKFERTVVVAARKKLIERKIDRLTFNVENSAMAGGLDAVQLLKNTPMVSVNDYSIGIVGKSSVKVMIDDKIVNMSGADVINYLKSLRSDDIAKIEIITAPPSKYAAEGNSGLLNIVLKKNSQRGWSGTVSASYTQATYPGYTDDVTLNYRTERVHTTVRLRQYDRAIRSTENIDIIGQQSLFSRDTRKDMDNGVGANVNFLFKVNNTSEFGLIYDLGRLHSNMNIDNRSVYQTADHLDSTLLTTSRHRNPITVQSLNTFYNLRLDTGGKKLTAGINYFSNTPRTEERLETRSPNLSSLYRVVNTSDIDYSILSGQLDLYLPYKTTVVEAGALITDFTNNSDVRYLNDYGPDLVLDRDRSNVFHYDEKNYALYASANREFGKTWSVKGGLRYEFSAIDGLSVTTGQRTTYSYGNLFPTLYVKRDLGRGNTLTVNYTKRINRPSFRALNPFRWYSNPFTFYTGNPLLRPSYNHNVEVSFLHKSIVSVSLYAQRLLNGYGRIVTLRNGIKEVNYANYLSESDFGTNASLYLNVQPWWEMNTDLTAFYSAGSSSVPDVVPQRGVSAYYDINNTFTLNKAKQVFLYLNFWNALPAKQANLASESLSSLTGGIRFNLFNSKLRVNAAVEDALRGLLSRGMVYFNEFVQRYENYYDSRRFTLSLTYSFGNKNVDANSKQVRFTEKNRIN